MRRFILIYAYFLIFLSLYPASGNTQTAQIPLSVWSEFQTDEDVLSSLPALSAQNISLDLNIPAARIGDPSMRDLIRSAGNQGILVKAWLTLPIEEGYWPGETNRQAFRQIVEQFVAWAKVESLPVHWVIFDMEVDMATTQTLLKLGEALASGDLNAVKDLYELLSANFNHTDFLTAAKDFADIVDFLHAQGFFAQATTYPTVLDDMADGDFDLQDVTNTPVWVPEAPIAWDLVSFMVYRTVYGEDRFSGDLIYRYSRDIVRYFGKAGALDLGIVGYDELTQSGYDQVSDLQMDYAAALATGISAIHVYSLGGILEMTPACLNPTTPCPWLDLSAVLAKRPKPEPSVGIMRRALHHADLWLNRQ